MIVELLAASIIAGVLAGAFKKARVPLITLAAIGIGTAMFIGIYSDVSADMTPARAEFEQEEWVNLTFTSDPTGADVFVGQYKVGTTPYTTQREAGEPFEYTIRMDDPHGKYDLYEPYADTVTPEGDMTVDVWLDRTTPEEQAVQRQQYEEAQAQAAARDLETVFEESSWSLHRRVDAITDADTSWITTPATRYPRYSDDAYMTIRCDDDLPASNDGIDLVIHADEYLGSRSLPLDWRFDDNPPVQQQRWRASTEGTGIFNVEYRTQFLTQMVEAETLIVRLYDYRGSSYDYEFDVAGARAALTRLGCYRGPTL